MTYNRREFFKKARDYAALGAGMLAVPSLFNGCGFADRQASMKDLQSFVSTYKEDGKLSLAELKHAAKQLLYLYEASPETDEQKKTVNKIVGELESIVQEGLSKSKGQVYIAINALVDRNGIRNRDWEGKTRVTTKDLAEDLKGSNQYFGKREVVELVAGADDKYSPTTRTVSDVEMRENGYVILRDTKHVERLLGNGEFEPLGKGTPFTKQTHKTLLGNDYAQGAYNKDIPAAVKLIINPDTLPAYEQPKQEKSGEEKPEEKSGKSGEPDKNKESPSSPDGSLWELNH